MKNGKLNTMKDIEHAIEGENVIALMTPQPGKNSWTWKELRESVINDMPLDDTNTNPVDDVLAMEKWTETKL